MPKVGRPIKGTGPENKVLKTRRTVPSAKLPKEDYISVTGVKLVKCYCRKCMRTKKPEEFYNAFDNGFIDASGKFSICTDCCNNIFDSFYKNGGESFEKAILNTCRAINMKFDLYTAKQSLENMMKANDKTDNRYERIFFFYKNLLYRENSSVGNTVGLIVTPNTDLTFREPKEVLLDDPLADDVPDAEYLKMFWGNSLETSEYIWLENEFSEWTKTHKSDTKAEITLIKEICFKGLEIRRARQENRGTGTLVKEYQELMKTANVDPAKTAIAGSGKSQDTFSAFVKLIEENEPAEYYQDKDLFKDFSNIGEYFQRYLTRPLKNFLKIGPPDFNVSDDTNDDYDEIDVDQVLFNGK